MWGSRQYLNLCFWVDFNTFQCLGVLTWVPPGLWQTGEKLQVRPKWQLNMKKHTSVLFFFSAPLLTPWGQHNKHNKPELFSRRVWFSSRLGSTGFQTQATNDEANTFKKRHLENVPGRRNWPGALSQQQKILHLLFLKHFNLFMMWMAFSKSFFFQKLFSFIFFLCSLWFMSPTHLICAPACSSTTPVQTDEQSLCPHTHDERSCSINWNNWSTKKTTNHEAARYSWKSESLYWFEEMLFTHFTIFTLVAQLKVMVLTPQSGFWL